MSQNILTRNLVKNLMNNGVLMTANNSNKKRIGILTGGGDAPGLNGIIESTTRVLLQNNYEIIGIKDGFEGVFNEDSIPLSLERIRGYHAEAGSILGASNKSPIKGREKLFIEKFSKLNLHGLIAVGGRWNFFWSFSPSAAN